MGTTTTLTLTDQVREVRDDVELAARAASRFELVAFEGRTPTGKDLEDARVALHNTLKTMDALRRRTFMPANAEDPVRAAILLASRRVAQAFDGFERGDLVSGTLERAKLFMDEAHVLSVMADLD